MPFARWPSPRRGVRLRVEIDEQDPLTRLGEAGGEVDGGGRLPDTALLVRDCVDAGWHGHILAIRADALATASGRFLATPVRRGNPAGVGAGLAEQRRNPPATRAARRRPRPRRGRRARDPPVGPTQRTTCAAGRDERQAPLDRGGRLGQAPSPCHAERVDGLLLGSAPDDTEVRELARPALEELALAALGLEQRDRRSGRLAASGMPGVPPPEPTSTIGPVERADQRHGGQRIVEQTRRAVAEVVDRGEARRGDDSGQPAVEQRGPRAARVSRRDCAGRRRRSDSARCPRSRVSTSGSSFSASWTTFRSIEVIGSSSTRRPVELARSALRRARASSVCAGGVAVAGGVDHHVLALVARPRCMQSRWRGTASRRSSGRDGRSARPRSPPPACRRSRRPSVTSMLAGDVDRGRGSGAGAPQRGRPGRVSPSLGPAAASTGSGAVDGRDHPCRRVADAEQAALALGEDLEADRVAVEPRRQPLELAEGRPLRLADGLARRLDACSSPLTAACPRPALLRLTRRGGPDAWRAADAWPSRAAVLRRRRCRLGAVLRPSAAFARSVCPAAAASASFAG